MLNVITDPLIDAAPCGRVSLPDLLAGLARDEVGHFPALRPHHAPAWHMFLVQVGALALHKAGVAAIPEDSTDWASCLRGLTPDWPNDEPWSLAVPDLSQPAFLQAPVPDGTTLANAVPTADALDLLITSRNHDLKQAIARGGEAQDWIFALVSLQTGEGYGGAGNHGIARMNGGSSSRAMLGLAPMPVATARADVIRPGLHFRRDVAVLLETRAQQLAAFDFYPLGGGLGLTWLAPWPEGEQLQFGALDIWFVEICRRVRLQSRDGILSAVKGTSKASRITAKHLNGAVGDPWAPIHKAENKSFTLAGNDFDYGILIELLLSGDWEVPLLARPASFEAAGQTLALWAAALSRGNSKTEGFKSRILPIGGRVSRALSLGPKRAELHRLAEEQAKAIDQVRAALGYGLALVAARGEREGLKKDHYAFARDAQARLVHAADKVFFEHLWARLDAQAAGAAALEAEHLRFVTMLDGEARRIFDTALPAIPCARIFRPRAEVRGRSAFRYRARKGYPQDWFTQPKPEDDDAAGHQDDRAEALESSAAP